MLRECSSSNYQLFTHANKTRRDNETKETTTRTNISYTPPNVRSPTQRVHTQAFHLLAEEAPGGLSQRRGLRGRRATAATMRRVRPRPDGRPPGPRLCPGAGRRDGPPRLLFCAADLIVVLQRCAKRDRPCRGAHRRWGSNVFGQLCCSEKLAMCGMGIEYTFPSF